MTNPVNRLRFSPDAVRAFLVHELGDTILTENLAKAFMRFFTEHYCRKCDTTLTEANWAPARQRTLHYICRPCDRTRHAAFHAAHPEKAAEYEARRQSKLKAAK